ncbi:hypothetical protein [Sinanaerobacter chloroacetimidivorans]|nr:hypothetical protein [Sinanaerobacter chloroacetimidivorans]
MLRVLVTTLIFMKMGSRIVAIPIKRKDELHVTKPKQKSTEPEL